MTTEHVHLGKKTCCHVSGKASLITINIKEQIIAVHLQIKPLVATFVEKHSQ